MISQKSLAPKRRFEGLTNDWNQFKLGDLSDIKTGPFGSTLHAEDYVEMGEPIVTTEHFKHGQLPENKKDIPQVSEIDYSRLESYKLQEEDIVFSRVGSVDINALVTKFQDGWLFSGRVLRVRPQSKIYSLYLHYLLETEYIKNDIISRAVGQTMPSINTEILKNTYITVSEKHEEQQKIGQFFKHLDEMITLEQRKIDKTKALKSAYLAEMFPAEGERVPKRRFEGFKDDWELFKLKELLIFEGKGRARADMIGRKSIYLDASYLNGGEKLSVNSPSNVEKDDVLILWDGSHAGKVYHGFEGALGSTLKVLKPIESGSFIYNYLFYKEKTILEQYRTPNIPHVINTFTDEFMIMKPNLEEQQKIGEFFKKIDSTISNHQQKLDKLKATKQAYLHEMFV